MRITIAALLGLALAAPASAAEIKVLSAGAYKQVVLAIQPEFEKQTGHTLKVDNDTVGGLVKRIEGSETFDVVIVSPSAVDDLTAHSKVLAGSRKGLGRVGVGVMVPNGAAKPDVSTVEAFKAAVLAAKSVAYIDPESGGSSGVYLEALFRKLGIENEVKSKAKLKRGGYVADLLVSGEADLGIHQISEILPVKGVTLVGPLPKEIQNYTVYAAGIAKDSSVQDAAKTLVDALAGPMAVPILKAKGMEAP